MVIQLHEIVSHCLEVLVDSGTELGQSALVPVLCCLLHLHQVVFHAIDLFLAQLCHERGDLSEHVAVSSICLSSFDLR